MSAFLCVHCEFRAVDVPLGTRCPRHPDAALIPESVHSHRRTRGPHLGRILGGKYALIGLIGGGGMGAVYSAVRDQIGGEVAIKLIRPEPDQSAEIVRQRFFGEARAMARLTDPATVRLLDYGEEPDGLLYMVLELVRGQNLKQSIRGERVIAPARAVTIASAVLDALDEAHAMKLVHRDIKPANIMLSRRRDGREVVKLLDFGIAKQVPAAGGDDDDALGLTQTGIVVGTPRYISPEQVRGEDVGPASDLYSTGVVLYHMLVGKAPFNGKSQYELFDAHVTQPVPRIPAEVGVPLAVEAVVRRAMSKWPDKRHATAAEMRDALRAAIDCPPEDRGPDAAFAPDLPDLGDGTGAYSRGEVPAMPLPASGRRSRWILPAGIVVAAAAAGLFFLPGAFRAPMPAAAPAAVAPPMPDATPPPDAFPPDATPPDAFPPDARPPDAMPAPTPKRTRSSRHRSPRPSKAPRGVAPVEKKPAMPSWMVPD